MALNKQIQNEILNDLATDFQRGMNKIQHIMQEKWGDEQNVEYKEVEELLYTVKVIEQRLRYLGGIH